MAASQTTNTMQERLTKLLQDVALAQALPDADLDFLSSLQQLLLDKVREPTQAAMQQAGMPAGGGAPPMGPPPGGGDPMGALMAALGGAGGGPLGGQGAMAPSPQNVPGGPGSMPVIPPGVMG